MTHLRDKLIAEELKTDVKTGKKCMYLTYVIVNCPPETRKLEDVLFLVLTKIQEKWNLSEENIYAAHTERNENDDTVYVYTLKLDWEQSRYLRYQEREKLFRKDSNLLPEVERELHEKFENEDLNPLKLSVYFRNEESDPLILAGLTYEYVQQCLEGLSEEERDKEIERLKKLGYSC